MAIEDPEKQSIVKLPPQSILPAEQPTSNGQSDETSKRKIPKTDRTGAKERAEKITDKEYDDFSRGTRTADDEIAPDFYEIKQAHVIVDRETYSQTQILNLDDVKEEPTGFYEEIYSQPGVTAVLHIKKQKKTLAQRNLRILKSQLSTALGQRVSAGKAEDSDLQRQFDEVNTLDNELSAGTEAVFKASALARVDVEGDDKTGPINLREAKRGLSVAVGKLHNRIRLRTPFLRSNEAFQSTLPLGEDVLNEPRNVHTTFLGAMYPFSSGQIVHEKGVWLGIAQGKKSSAVFFDCWDPLVYNGNGIILGVPGTGKSATLKTWALRHILHQKRVFVLDAAQQGMREYEQACAMVGGTYVRMGPNSTSRMNFLEITPYNPDDDEQSNPYDDQMELAPEFLRFIIQDPAGINNARAPYTIDEEAVIRRALERMYASHEIYREEPENFINRKMPILDDLKVVLEQIAERGDNDLDIEAGDSGQRKGFQAIAEKYASRLKSRMDQPSIKMFTQQTNIDMDQPMVVLEVGNMPKDMKAMAYTVAGKVFQDKLISDPAETVFIGDEAQIVLSDTENEAANNIPKRFFGNFSEKSRKLQCGFWVATHNIGNLLDAGIDGDKIIVNAGWRFIMGQDELGIQRLKQTNYKFSDFDLRNISGGKARKGLGIFMKGSGLDGGTRVLMQVERIPIEEAVTSTSARDEVDPNSIYLRDVQAEDDHVSADNLLPLID